MVHWRVRNDGVRVVDEVVVAAHVRRQGYGRALLNHVGRPVELKVDATNKTGAMFALGVGLQPVARVPSKGRGTQHTWLLFQGA